LWTKFIRIRWNSIFERAALAWSPDGIGRQHRRPVGRPERCDRRWCTTTQWPGDRARDARARACVCVCVYVCVHQCTCVWCDASKSGHINKQGACERSAFARPVTVLVGWTWRTVRSDIDGCCGVAPRLPRAPLVSFNQRCHRLHKW